MNMNDNSGVVRVSTRRNKGFPPRRFGECNDSLEVNQDIHQMIGNNSHRSDEGIAQASITQIPVEAQVEIIAGPSQMLNSAPSRTTNASSRVTQCVFAQRRILAEIKKKKELLKLQEEQRRQQAELLELEYQADIAEIDIQSEQVLGQGDGGSQHLSDEQQIGVGQQTTVERVQNWIEEIPTSELHQAAESNHHCDFHRPSVNHPQALNPEARQYHNQGLPPIPESQQISAQAISFQQREWRKTVGKDLPNFNGNLEDWPEYLNRYRISSEKCGFDNQENMSRLRSTLKDKAKDVVKAIMLTSDNPDLVIEVLQRKFGRPDHIIKKLLEKARNSEPLKDSNLETLVEFSESIRNFVAIVESLKKPSYLINTIILDEFVCKLTETYRRRWGQHIGTREVDELTIKDFSMWISQEAKWAENVCQSIPSFTKTKGDQASKDTKKSSTKRKDQVFVTCEESSETQATTCLFCEKEGHNLTKCWKFLKEKVDRRWEFVKGKRICFSCLKSGHQIKDCQSIKACSEDGCTKKHHPNLHRKNTVQRKAENIVIQEVGHARSFTLSARVLTKVIAVELKGPAGFIKTYALLDDGSEITMLQEDIANKLGLNGQMESFQMRTANGVSTERSRRVNLQIKGFTASQLFNLESVRTVKFLPLRVHTVNVPELVNKWPHLAKVEVDSLRNAKPTIIIGQDHGDLIVAEESIRGPWKSPILSKTALGWVIHGSIAAGRGQVKQGLQCYWMKEEKEEELHQMIKDSFKTESFGVKIIQDRPRSREDKKAEEIINMTTKRVGERFETGLLWRDEDPVLPKSKGMAMKRLQGVERKMDRDQGYAQEYCSKIEDYISKGYVRKLDPQEAAQEESKTWYLPHFAVINPNKPGKLRLVFDAAAKSQGVSFNDAMLTGPDLLNSLVGVLLKFRQHRIGFCADIKEMFHQVLIRSEDLQAQRFLWRGLDRNTEPDVMQMNVMIFGSACSPCSAQEVKNRNAREFEEEFPEAVKAIVERHYVDDYLDSSDKEDQAIQLIHDVIEVHRRGGFQICGWICSSKKVLERIPVELRAVESKDVNLSSSTQTQRVLGLHWDTQEDVFKFKLTFDKIDKDIILGKKRPTKRQILCIVMSVFDPLGFVAHLMVKAKILMQDIWRTELGWDDELTEALDLKWKSWLKELEKVKDVIIPRCYSAQLPIWSSVQLHIFCDAGEKAFSAVAYFRFNKDEDVKTALVMARTRVAPLRLMSIPRLELQAAVMASRLAQTIKDEHEFKVESLHFWTDSKTVLCWLRSDSRRFKMFVAHRVGEIEEITDISSWHWVPSKENVADDATKETIATDVSKDSRWWTGPPFLCLPKENWPVESKRSESELDEEPSNKDLEVKSEFVHLTALEKDCLPEIQRFSSWLRLIRATAWMLRFIRLCLSRSSSDKCTTSSELSVEEHDAAVKLWIKRVQCDAFQRELHCLRQNASLPKNSQLLQLSPMLDEDGIIRVKGRIEAAPGIAFDVKSPVILDPKHPFTKLLIIHYHTKAGHQGQESVVNELRQRFWILNARRAVRSAWNCCQLCKNKRAMPCPPEMGSLPVQRLTAFERAFTFTGMDYFGPMAVKIGRRHEKRYGVLFSCLTTRAIHLEIAASLTTDSCIMAIRRFISRRGHPQEIYSDNGTNLRGARTELKKALLEIDQDRMCQEFASKEIRWNFIPPLSPHMGGSWERMVRAVKSALGATLRERCPTEEVLQTLFTEAENSVNSRPLTYVAMDSAADEALTPNHFLIGSSSAVQPPGKFGRTDLCLRKHWRTAQALADMFWQRWIREYLPTLTRRTKWHQRLDPVKVGDVVIIVDDSLPRNSWPRGIVATTYPGKDGQVRVVNVKTSTGLFRRPVTKLCVLDI